MKQVVILALGCSVLFACEEKKEEPKPAEVAQAATPEPEGPKAEEKTAEQKEAEMKAVQEAKAQEAVEKNPLTACCRALGKEGFTQRSPEYMAASKECGAAMTDKKDLKTAVASIKKELKGKALPDDCQAK